MKLYEALAPLYDRLFPPDPRATSFLDSLARHPRSPLGPRGTESPRLLDAGCATGSQALALAALGWTAVGIDSEAAMIEAARERAAMQGRSNRATFREADILAAEALFGPPRSPGFDLVLCLGNTLPHLVGEGGAGPAAFLRQAGRLLAPGGALVLQTLNFSLPGVGPGFAFPDIEAEGATMRRRYLEPPPGSPGLLRFVVELARDGETARGEALLAPLPPRLIGSMLAEAGFSSLARYSGWVGDLFEEDRDLFCVFVARA
jgi:SAM-dependent methyltransferase